MLMLLPASVFVLLCTAAALYYAPVAELVVRNAQQRDGLPQVLSDGWRVPRAAALEYTSGGAGGAEGCCGLGALPHIHHWPQTY